MKNKFAFFLFLFLVLNSCNKSVQNKINFSKEEIKKNTIIDLSEVVKFDNTSDKIKIIDTLYFSEISDYLRKNQRESKVLVQSNHGERFLLNTHFSYGEQVKEYFIKSGVSREKIASKIGFEFGKRYSTKFSKSRIVLIII